jgi:hypothetical protein
VSGPSKILPAEDSHFLLTASAPGLFTLGTDHCSIFIFLFKDNLMLNALPNRIREHVKVTYTAEHGHILIAPPATA